VIPEPATNAASTLHFIQPTPGFSQRTDPASSTGTTLWHCSWWTVNHSFHTTNAILPAWLGGSILSFQIMWFRLSQMHQNNDATHLLSQCPAFCTFQAPYPWLSCADMMHYAVIMTDLQPTNTCGLLHIQKNINVILYLGITHGTT
jgi:hypothetical protein